MAVSIPGTVPSWSGTREDPDGVVGAGGFLALEPGWNMHFGKKRALYCDQWRGSQLDLPFDPDLSLSQSHPKLPVPNLIMNSDPIPDPQCHFLPELISILYSSHLQTKQGFIG